MGTFALTNPALAYDPGQGADPTTGMPIQLPPIVKYFKNAALRGHQAALDEMASVQPGRSDISGANGAPAQIPLPASSRLVDPVGVKSASNTGGGIPAYAGPTVETIPGQADQNQTSQTSGTSSAPRFVQPNFSQTTKDANGLPLPINPAETKLGKLVHILASAGQGALAGWGTGNPGAGAAQAREIPFQQAEQHQQLAQQQAQLAVTRTQSAMVPTPMGPMPVGMAKAIFPSIIRAGATTGAAQIGANSRENVADTAAQSRETVANTNKRFIPVAGVGLFDSQNRSLVPDTGKGIVITPEIAADHGLPSQFIGKMVSLPKLFSMSPKSTVENESQDLMGDTTNRKTTTPVISRSGASGGTSGLPTARTPAPLVQRTAGGPLVPQTVAQPTGRTTPARANAATPNLTTPAKAAIPLPPDVEQRLVASGLNPQEQAYVRGLLNYQGQLPSPRARNYAPTLATLTSIDPSFQAANYDANKKTFMDYTPGGSVGKQAIAFNTAIAHLDMLDQAAQALNSTNYPAVNRVAQFFKVQTGKDPVTTFNNIADAVDGEVSKTFKGTATEGELARVGAHFNAALGPAQIQNNVRSTIGLLNGKMGEMESAFQRQVGRPIDMVSPPAKSAIQRMSGGPGGIQVTDPRGVVHTFANQSAANNFKSLAHIQ